ncbi:hypothetical protein GQX74_004476 [Glossina fuscipes]|nr:hypothetical protein GQX74_004476 [Glossina fuscipes]
MNYLNLRSLIPRRLVMRETKDNNNNNNNNDNMRNFNKCQSLHYEMCPQTSPTKRTSKQALKGSSIYEIEVLQTTGSS